MTQEMPATQPPTADDTPDTRYAAAVALAAQTIDDPDRLAAHLRELQEARTSDYARTYGEPEPVVPPPMPLPQVDLDRFGATPDGVWCKACRAQGTPSSAHHPDQLVLEEWAGEHVCPPPPVEP